MKKNIAVIPGDGIGPEIVKEAVNVLKAIEKKYQHEFTYTEVCAGGCAIDKYGKSLPEESLQACLDSDSVLLGAVGGPKRDNVDPSIRPSADCMSQSMVLHQISQDKISLLRLVPFWQLG